jgi:hypothetical protein
LQSERSYQPPANPLGPKQPIQPQGIPGHSDLQEARHEWQEIACSESSTGKMHSNLGVRCPKSGQTDPGALQKAPETTPRSLISNLEAICLALSL